MSPTNSNVPRTNRRRWKRALGPQWLGCRNSTRRVRRRPPSRRSMPRPRIRTRSAARCCWPNARPTRRWRVLDPKRSRSFARPRTRHPRHSTRLARCRRSCSSRHAPMHARSVKPSATRWPVRSRPSWRVVTSSNPTFTTSRRSSSTSEPESARRPVRCSTSPTGFRVASATCVHRCCRRPTTTPSTTRPSRPVPRRSRATPTRRNC